MDKSQEILKRCSSADTKYFKIADGQEKRVRYLYAEEVPNEFNEGKNTILRYWFEEGGKKKPWDRVSKQLMREMSKVSEGDWIYLKRIGKGKDTIYSIRKVEE